MAAASDRIVVVGASAGGVATAEGLRRLGYDGELIIVGGEPEIAHDRPPLSKQVLAGTWEPERAALLPPGRRDRIAASWRLGTAAIGLNTQQRVLTLDDGTTLAYNELVIATGVRPRPLPGGRLAGVHLLRTANDALALRSAIVAERRLVVVGAGFLGLEVAATARRLGAAVTVVEPVIEPLGSRLGRAAAARLVDLHRANGVEVRLGVSVGALEPDTAGHVRRILLDNGEWVDAPVILVAIGCAPNVEWLKDSILDISDGVACDEYCRAAPGVWAVGDVARWRHPLLHRSMRIEHRLNASEQGNAVAANITGRPAPYAPTPFFWTDHYHSKIQVAGIIDESAEERVLDLGQDNSFLHTYHVDGQLTAVLGWNAAKAMMPYRQKLRDGRDLARQ